MKTRILSLAIAFITLFAINTAFAQSPHFVGEVCYDSRTGIISGKIAGLGNDITGISVVIADGGEYSCQSKGGGTPTPKQDLPLTTFTLEATKKPGSYTFRSNESLKLCPNRNWTPSIDGSVQLKKDGATLDEEPICSR
jgi:hypothetical protein